MIDTENLIKNRQFDVHFDSSNLLLLANVTAKMCLIFLYIRVYIYVLRVITDFFASHNTKN